MGILEKARKNKVSILATARKGLGISREESISSTLQRIQEMQKQERMKQAEASASTSLQDFQKTQGGILGTINRFLGRGTTLPTKTVETPDYASVRQQTQPTTFGQSLSKIGTGAKELFTGATTETAYDLLYQKGVDQQNIQNIERNNKLIANLAIKNKTEIDETTRIARESLMKKIFQTSQNMASGVGGELAKKDNAQLVGQSLMTALELTPALGFKEAGKLALKFGLKQATKEVAKQATKEMAKETGFFGGIAGLASGLEEKDRTVGSVAKSTAIGTGLGAGLGFGLGKVGEIFTKLAAKRLNKNAVKTIEKEIGKLDTDEQSAVKEGLSQGLSKDEIKSGIVEARKIDTEFAPEAPKLTPEPPKVEKPATESPLIQEARSSDDVVKILGQRPYVSGSKAPWNPDGLGWKYKDKSGNVLDVPESMSKVLDKDKFTFLKSDKITKTSSNLYHTTPIENLESIRKNGLTTGNKARFEGVSSPNKISFSANEKGASYYGSNNDVIIRTKSGFKPDDLDLDLLAGGEGTYRTGKNIPPEMLEAKINGKWQDLVKSQPLQEGVEKVAKETAEEVERKTSKIAKSIERKMKDAGMIDEGADIEKATFEGITVKGQAEEAAKIIQDKQLVDDIISGKTELSTKVRPSTFIKAVEDKALKEGDVATIEKLAKSKLAGETSVSAQDLRLAAERDPDSAVIKLREIAKAREEALAKRLKKGESVGKAKSLATKEVEKASKTKKSTKATWSSFISEIKC